MEKPRLGPLCLCEVDESIPEERFKVIFRYVPDHWLVLKGFKELVANEEDDEEDGFEIDIHRTNRSTDLLSRRRAREQAASLPDRKFPVSRCFKTSLILLSDLLSH